MTDSAPLERRLFALTFPCISVIILTNISPEKAGEATNQIIRGVTNEQDI